MKNYISKHFYLFVATTVLLCACGCGSSGGERKPNETVKGLQEENKVLREKIEGLENDKTTDGMETKTKIEELKKEHEDSLARERELHRSKVAQLEKEIADLRLGLGASQREKIALQEMVDRTPRIKEASNVRQRIDTLVLCVLLGIALILLAYVAFRYRSISDRLNLVTMQQIGELRRIGGDV